MSRLAVAALLLIGCKFDPQLVGGASGDGATGDASAADGDAADAAVDSVQPDAFVCSAAALACPNAAFAPIAITCNGACWAKCQSNSPFSDESLVAGHCRDWGGKLAPVRDAADQTCVTAMLFPSQASWIGFEQASNQGTTAAGWSWNSDLVASSFVNWSPGQPNDADGSESGFEQCAFMTTNGTWQDVPCTGANLFRYSCRHD